MAPTEPRVQSTPNFLNYTLQGAIEPTTLPACDPISSNFPAGNKNKTLYPGPELPYDIDRNKWPTKFELRASSNREQLRLEWKNLGPIRQSRDLATAARTYNYAGLCINLVLYSWGPKQFPWRYRGVYNYGTSMMALTCSCMCAYSKLTVWTVWYHNIVFPHYCT